MKWLIDGHNLIPKMGLSLRAETDEASLSERLNEYARLTGRTIEVYFDRGRNGAAHEETVGTIRVHFVSGRTSADAALIYRVSKMKKSDSITVVTSDRSVQVQVRGFGARVVSSEAFAAEVEEAFRNPPKRRPRPQAQRDEPRLSESEIAFWADIFSSGRPEKYSE